MTLQTLLQQGGPIMPVILVTALAGYLLAIERLIVWGGWRLRERELFRVQDAAALHKALARGSGGPQAGTPLALLVARAEALRGLPDTEREWAMEREILTRIPAVEARIATIGWLAAILPMLGLLGTVSGMIVTFQELALSASRQVLSQGLSEALWTTEVGLLGALPLLAAHHGLTRLKARWLNRLEWCLACLFEEPAAAPARKPRRGGRAREA